MTTLNEMIKDAVGEMFTEMPHLPSYDPAKPRVKCAGREQGRTLAFAPQAHSDAMVEWFRGFLLASEYHIPSPVLITWPTWCSGCMTGISIGLEEGFDAYSQLLRLQGGRLQ